MRFEVQTVEKEGKKFHYVDFGREVHDKPSFRLWINPKCLPEEGTLDFPLLSVKLIMTKKGTPVLTPSEDSFTVIAGWQCGFRGRSYLEVITPKEATVRKFYQYLSPRGSLGISEYAVVSAPKDKVLRVRIWRDGRLHGAPAELIQEWTVVGEQILYTEYPPELLELDFASQSPC